MKPFINLGLVARRILASCLLAAAIVAVPPAAVAQCAPSPDGAAAISAAASVFVGRVAAVSDGGRVAEVDVLSIWTGPDLPPRVEVRGAVTPDAPASSTDRRFEVGEVYLVIPENGREPFLATACSSTQSFFGAPNIVPAPLQDAVGSAQGRSPVAVATEDGEAAAARSIIPLFGIAALILGAWVLIARLRSGMPERAPASTPPPVAPGSDTPRRKPFKKRNRQKDVAYVSRSARRKVKRIRRGFRGYRRRQNRHVAASRKASGSTDSS